MDVVRYASTFLFDIILYLLRYNRIKQNFDDPTADHSVV